jgi:hypothetical protein
MTAATGDVERGRAPIVCRLNVRTRFQKEANDIRTALQ